MAKLKTKPTKPVVADRPPRPRPPASTGGDASEARLAVGSLLSFYRKTKRVNQTQATIADAAGLTSSALGMFEAGKRIPNQDAIKKLAGALGLDDFQRQQLQLISSYDRQGPLIGEQWFVPGDVLTGTPIFLRNLEREIEAQREAAISEMWIVTRHPLALEGKMYDLLKYRLANEATNFVYFIDSSVGESPFRALLNRLLGDMPGQRGVLIRRLRGVLIPASFCIDHYAICNPGQLTRMFGRLIVYASGIPVGFVSMDSQQVTRAYYLLAPVYQQLPCEREIQTEYGRFRQI
jgi:transcriptional regulator with XRE-family HTH domain